LFLVAHRVKWTGRLGAGAAAGLLLLLLLLLLLCVEV
jgi:hypothetical protein